MKAHQTWKCPFGPAIIRAASDKELRTKAEAHLAYAHGPQSIVACR